MRRDIRLLDLAADADADISLLPSLLDGVKFAVVAVVDRLYISPEKCP